MPLSFCLSTVTVVLIVRTYAVWNRDKRVGIGLALLFILCQTPMGIISEKWIGAAHRGYCVDSSFFLCSTSVPPSAKPFPLAIQNPYPEIFRGCFYGDGTRLIFVNWVIIVIEEGGTLSAVQSQEFSLTGTGTTQLITF